jgi:cytochrome bd-type quinol oxidase subunit 2
VLGGLISEYERAAQKPRSRPVAEFWHPTGGLAQYPYLFPTSLPLAAGSAPTASLVALFVVAGLAALLVAPGFALLYYLQ